MTRLLALILLHITVTATTAAQDFPAPGTGLLSFEPVGNRPIDAESFAFASDGALVAFHDSLFRFAPDPAGVPAGQWIAVVKPTTNLAFVSAVGPTADTLFVGRPSDILRTTDGGSTWVFVHEGGGPNQPDAFSALPTGHANAGRLLAGGDILFSDDRGATWTEAARSFPGEQGRAYAFAVLPSGRVLMAGSWGVAASDDGGASYAVTPLWGDYAVETHTITALATPGSTQSGQPACGQAGTSLCDGAVVAGISVTAPDMQVWRTHDGGRTWSAPVSLPEPYDGVGTGYPASVVALPPGADGLGRALIVGRRGVIFRTLDGGLTWEAVARLPIRPVVNGSPSHRVKLARLGPDGHLWVATLLNGPEREWMYRSAEPAEAAFWVSSEDSPEPAGVRLNVQPNPSGAGSPASVALTLATPATSATVTVLDALGRQVAVLHDGSLAAGTHTFPAAAASLAPGVYTVRAEAGSNRLTRSFSVVR